MHIDLGRSEKAMRNDAAKRTSEGTEAAARIANQAGYQSVKRSKLAWTSQDGDAPIPSPGAGLAPLEAKGEQTRLLTLLRAVNPAVVADQLYKAVAFFGGIPGAPPPETRAHFPQSNHSNGSGSQFVSWLAEIFPASADHSALLPPPPAVPNPKATQTQTPPVSAQPPSSIYNAPQPGAGPSAQPADAPGEPTTDPNAPAVPVKRGRGRPKGSKGKPKNKDQPPADSDHMAMHGSQGPNATGAWPGQPMYPSQQGTPGQSDTGTPGKKRGRPKGSKNKPKNPDAATGDAETAPGQDADESQTSFMSPMGQLPNSMPLGQDGLRSSSGPTGLSHMIEPNNTQTQSAWTTVGMPATQDASPAASRKRKNEKQQPDAPSSTPNMLPGIQQDGAHTDANGKRRRFSKDGAVFPQMASQTRMTSSESPVQNSNFQSPSQQMMSSGSFDPAQQHAQQQSNRKPGARNQPPSRPGQSQPQQQQYGQTGQPQSQQQPFPSQSSQSQQQPFNPQSNQSQQQPFNPQSSQSQQQPFNSQASQSQQQPFGQQAGQHKSPVIGGNQPQQPGSGMDMSGSGLSRNAMYNQQQQLQHFMNQQRLSVDMNAAGNPSNQFSQGTNDGKSPMFPHGHMVRAASGDASMQHQQRPSPAGPNAQLTHDGSRMSQPNFGRAPPVTSAAASPSIHSPFPPNYAARNYMGMSYGGMGGSRVPDASNHSFGGSAGQMDGMNGADQASIRQRMYQTMQQQHQQQQRQ